MCSNTVIPALYEETRRGVVKELSDTAYVVLTSDRWTSRATESFLTVTAHYITLVTVNNYLFLPFVNDTFLCQINEKHVGTLAVPESTYF